VFSAGKLEGQTYASLLFSVLGFVGGLFAAKEPKSN
jgi:hypothetical protein